MSLWVQVGDGGVLSLRGEFDLAETHNFEAAAEALLDGQREIVLDLTELTFLDSSGIRAIVDLSKRVEPRPVVIRNADGSVAKVLDIVNIEQPGHIRIER